jgi:hypothetical protein
MPSLQKNGNGWYCQFLYHGKRHTISIGHVPETEAHAKSDQANYLLIRLRQRLIGLPPGVDIREFLQRDGQVSALAVAPAQTRADPVRVRQWCIRNPPCSRVS